MVFSVSPYKSLDDDPNGDHAQRISSRPQRPGRGVRSGISRGAHLDSQGDLSIRPYVSGKVENIGLMHVPAAQIEEIDATRVPGLVASIPHYPFYVEAVAGIVGRTVRGRLVDQLATLPGALSRRCRAGCGRRVRKGRDNENDRGRRRQRFRRR